MRLIMYSNDENYDQLLYFMFEKYNDKFNDFSYVKTSIVKNYSWEDRFNKNKIKICQPSDTKFSFTYKQKPVEFSLQTIRTKDGEQRKIIIPQGCSTNQDVIFKKATLIGETKQLLIDIIDEANDMCEKKMEESKKKENNTINIHYWRKDFWNMLFECPKRPIETLYLKEGVKEEIIQKIEEFFSEETRGEYISYGIPYKNVFLLYGVPGSGKTSTIRTIASYLDCNVFVIPISKELTDYGLIDAISYMDDSSNKKKKKRIIVIEDIDCIFTERKKGDDVNGVTLQGLLNCFDGFSCVEGTLLFLTANKPEVLDQAMIRSCRIDHKYCLDYADKYQTEKIFTMIMKDKKELFDKFYSKIESREYTTAMLQEFLFFNRKNDTFMDSIKDFYKIIEKNNLESLTTECKSNVYM